MTRTSGGKPRVSREAGRVPKSSPRRRAGQVLAAVRPFAARIAAEQGVVVWGVEFAREGGADILRVAVDRAGGIDSDGIARFADALSRELDEADVVAGEDRYVLEVTSPGAERRLRSREEFEVCLGRHARVTFRTGREPLEARISAVSDEAVTLQGDVEGEVDVPYADISQARLVVRVAAAPKPGGPKSAKPGGPKKPKKKASGA